MLISPIVAYDCEEERDVIILSFLRDETCDCTLAVCMRKDGSMYSTHVCHLVVQDTCVQYMLDKLGVIKVV